MLRYTKILPHTHNTYTYWKTLQDTRWGYSRYGHTGGSSRCEGLTKWLPSCPTCQTHTTKLGIFQNSFLKRFEPSMLLLITKWSLWQYSSMNFEDLLLCSFSFAIETMKKSRNLDLPMTSFSVSLRTSLPLRDVGLKQYPLKLSRVFVKLTSHQTRQSQ